MTDLDKYKILFGISAKAAEIDTVDLHVHEDVARGFASPELDLRALATQFDPQMLNSPTLEQWNLEMAHFQERPQVIRIRPLPENLQLRHAGEDKLQTYSEFPEEIYIDLATTSSPIAFVTDDGEGFILDHGEDILQIRSFLNLPETLNFNFSLSSPITKWLDQSDDDWIIEKVQSKLNIDDPWIYLTTVGFFHRLERIEDRERRAHLVQQILAGKLIDERERAIQWAESLPHDKTYKLAARTIEATNRLQRQLGELRRGLEEGEEEFLSLDTLSALHLRDDIESALFLLNATVAQSRLKEVSAVVDAFGEELLPALRKKLGVLDDERLRRVSTITPFVWWARLAREPYDTYD